MTHVSTLRNTDLRDSIAGYLRRAVIASLPPGYFTDGPVSPDELAGQPLSAVMVRLRLACTVLSQHAPYTPERRFAARIEREETLAEIRRRLARLD